MFRRRMQFLAACFGILYLGLLGRLVSLQLLEGTELRKKGEDRIHRLEQIPPRRGEIVDRNGRVLAADAPACEIWFTPGRWRKGEGQRHEELALGAVTAARVRAIRAASGEQQALERSLALEDLRDRLPLAAYLARVSGRTPDEVASALLAAAEEAVADESKWALFAPRLVLRDVGTKAYYRILTDQALYPAAPEREGVEARIGFMRVYPHGAAAAHITGYVAPLSAGEYERLRGRWGPEGMIEGEGEIPGFFIPTETERYVMRLYETARQGRPVRVAGFLANPLVGRGGAEERYNTLLRGAHGLQHLRLARTEDGGRAWQKVESYADGAPGERVELTLSAETQQAVYDILVEEAEKVRQNLVAHKDLPADEVMTAACVLINPHTGAIQALVSLPSFDPARVSDLYREYADPRSGRPLLNRATSGIYAPGSTFKPVIALGALCAGVIQPETTFDCEGVLSRGGHDFICMRRYAHGTLNVVEALRVSCNVFFYHAAAALGRPGLYAFTANLGFGQPTGIDLPGEGGGQLPQYAADGRGWSLGATYHWGIGQGIAVTPLQMAVAVSAIANGGAIVRPHLLQLADPQANEELNRPLRRLALPATALAAVRRGMWEVVNENGTGKACRFRTLEVAGKTGSADWGGSQRDRQTHAWFVCYAPAENPQVVGVLVLPGGGLGGGVCAPIMRRILEQYFQLHEAEGAVG